MYSIFTLVMTERAVLSTKVEYGTSLSNFGQSMSLILACAAMARAVWLVIIASRKAYLSDAARRKYIPT